MSAPRPPRPLNAEAVKLTGRAISKDRYLSIKVSDEQLVTKIIETYRDLTRRPERRRKEHS